MKRWEILIWLVVVFSSVGLISWLIYSRVTQDDSPNENLASYDCLGNQSLPKTNAKNQTTQPRLAGNGSPLPTVTKEDVVLEYYEFGSDQIYLLAYDYQTKNWQFQTSFNYNLYWLRYIDKSQQFFLCNHQLKIWDEVEDSLLSPDIRDLTNLEKYFLTDSDLEEFIQISQETEAVDCKQDPKIKCVAWVAYNFNNYEQVLIYVNTQTYKIDQVLTFNPTQTKDPALIVDYKYQSVEILPPAETEARYLPK